MLTWKLEFFDNGNDKAPSRTTTIEAATMEEATETMSLSMQSDELRVDATPVDRCRQNVARLD